MDLEDRIEVNPLVMLGKPVIKGTRITVELILERLQAGETVKQIVNSLRNIDANDIQAAIEYALESVRKEKVYVVPGEAQLCNL
ncbi:MAG TPA: DUF433 domain-containing protein [Candidatus Deferrimicrobium sp.]|nr:DUF433 domain-containing protein [Candidatus Kapabacteria bacterium]HLP58493.1 DUF433 domain-containing protein [Candidatus Deferrimicrobium sp.]